MDIGEAEAFSERLKRELQALEAANIHAIMENESLIREVVLFSLWWVFAVQVGLSCYKYYALSGNYVVLFSLDLSSAMKI